MQTLLMMLAMAVCDGQPLVPGTADPCLEWERTNAEILAGSHAKEQTSLAAGQAVSSADPSSIVGFLRLHGYQALLQKDKFGDPMIAIGTDAYGGAMQVLLNDCEDHRNCQALMLRRTYPVPDHRPPSLDLINLWNSSDQQYGRAWRTPYGQAVLDMPLVAVSGELPSAQLLEALRLFEELGQLFERHIRTDGR